MNIFVCGQKSFGKEVLLALIEDGHTITGLAPAPQKKYYDKPVGVALLHGIPIICDGESLASDMLPNGTDLVVAAHSHWYISEKLLAKARFGGIGFHPSLLPRHRGRDAVRWAVAMGDAVTGASVYRLGPKVDGGDILLQEPVFIGRGWDAHRLWSEIFPRGVGMIREAVRLIEAGGAIHKRQDELFATWEPAFDSAPRLHRNELIALGAMRK